MLIAHRVNTLNVFYHLYYVKGFRAFELDIQVFNNAIVVEHDELRGDSDVDLLITLEEYLKFTPKDIFLNVEVKNYDHRIGRREAKKIHDTCMRYPKKAYMYSSFDSHIHRYFRDRGVNTWLLFEKDQTLDDTKRESICIHKSMLPSIMHYNHVRGCKIAVYDLKKREVPTLAKRFAFVKYWIVD